MNTQDQFDELVTEHLRARAPREAPDRLLEMTMNQISSTPQRTRTWLGGRFGTLLAAAAVLLLAIVAGTQLAGLIDRPVGDDPSPSPAVAPSATAAPPATAAPSATPTTSPTSAPSNPPATPQPTESPVAGDALLLRVVSMGGGPIDPASLLSRTTLMADGTLIWQPISSQTDLSSFVTRTLTEEGLADLRQYIFGSGLLDANAAHELEPQPGLEPPGRGVSVHQFTAGDGDDSVVVTSVQWLGDDEEAAYFQPAPEREQLDALALALRDPESLVGDDAWAGPAAPYEADEYQLVLTPYRDVPPYGNPDVSNVPIPLDGPLDEFGAESGDPRPPVTRCGVLDRAEASGIVDALVAMGSAVTNMVGLDGPSVASLDWAEGNGAVDLYLLPRMPDGYPECDDQG